MTRDPVEVLRRVRERDLFDQDGDRIVLDFALPLTDDEIVVLQDDVGLPLPDELVATLRETREIDGIEPIDFTGRTMDVEVGELSPSGHPFAADGFGNFWFLDLTPEDTECAPVFFLCHDPPVVVFQSPTLGDFLNELFRIYEPPHESAVIDVHDGAAFEIWRTNPGVIDHETALSGDDELRAFAGSLDDRFEFVDLRSPAIGMGFSWGRHGPRTEIRRHRYTRLFAYARHEKTPGFFSRLRGR